MEQAFADVYDRPDALAGLDFRGMTDPVILRRAIARLKQPHDERAVQTLIDAYLMHLRRTIAQTDAFQVLPGVRDLLDRLSVLPHLATGLGTGNLEAGARIKLDRAELNQYFPFGGFGSDHEDRAKLLETGARRGAARLGTRLAQCRVVVVGDTPRDVAAARAIGAECVAVATGGHSVARLTQAGATVVLTSLADVRAPAAISG
jgi:phosphoglycolate phosphatase